MLKLHVQKNGYQFACLSRGAQRCVHRLVLEAFVGPRPAGHQAAHWDGDKLNNAVENLRWATRKENEADKLRHGRAVFGANSPNGRKTHCSRGHPYDEKNTRRAKGRRHCRTCRRDLQRRANGTRPSRFRTPVEPRLSEALRLVAAGMPATQVAKVGLSTIARARRSGTHR